MSSQDRRVAARRRAWGRGPIILKFEPLEGRQLLTTPAAGLPDIVASSFTTQHTADWGDTFNASGTILNQGKGTASGSFEVEIFASPTPDVTRQSVPIGMVQIPAGLAPGQSAPFSENITLPTSPVPGFGSSTNGVVYINLWVDPKRAIKVSNRRDHEDLGAPYDTSPVQITAQQPSDLVGTSLSITPNNVEWGNTVQIYAQIHNAAQGDAPPTTARVVLTPAGQAFGGPNDTTIATFPVPAIAAWQTVNVVQTITLPDLPATTLAGSTDYTLTVLPDANYQTNIVYPGYAPQGSGLDQTPITINANPNVTATQGALPDLASTTVNVPSTALNWGQTFQVSTSVQNLGQVDSGAYNVVYLLVGPSGSLSEGLVLADVNENSLGAGDTQALTQTLKLPVRVPSGMTLSSVGLGRIAIVIDPHNMVDEVTKNDNVGISAPVTLRLLGTDGSSTVPNSPGFELTQTTSTTTATKTTTTRVPTLRPGAKIHRRPTSHVVNFNSIEHNLTVFPQRVTNLVKDIFK